MTTIKHFDRLTTEELYRILRAREEVFTLGQGVNCEDMDGVDPKCIHMWESGSEGDLAGYLRIAPPGLIYRQASIGRVLVSEPYRRKGICRRMMLSAIEYIQVEWPGEQIMISAQSYLMDFYSELGFKVVSEEYPDGGIPHRKMLYIKG